MLGVDRRAAAAAWTVFLFALAVALVYLMRHTVIVFALAVFLAHLISPAVDAMERIMPTKFHVSRAAASGLVYLLLFATAFALLIPIGAAIGEQAANLAARLPSAIQQDPLAQLPLPSWLEQIRPDLTVILRARMLELGQSVLPMLSSAGAQLLSGLGNLFALILVPVLSFFFVKDGRVIRGKLIAAAPADRQLLVLEILEDLHRLLMQYIRALVLLAAATFISHSAALSLMGVPYSILLAGLAAILEFIPVLGPLTAAAIILIVSAFAGYTHLLWIAVFLGLYRVFQDYVLNPYLMSNGAALHPLLVLFGVLGGERIGGIPGMFFSVPVMAALRVIVIRVRRSRDA
jgi:predicted PurR-regulated permease PerM